MFLSILEVCSGMYLRNPFIVDSRTVTHVTNANYGEQLLIRSSIEVSSTYHLCDIKVSATYNETISHVLTIWYQDVSDVLTTWHQGVGHMMLRYQLCPYPYSDCPRYLCWLAETKANHEFFHVSKLSCSCLLSRCTLSRFGHVSIKICFGSIQLYMSLKCIFSWFNYAYHQNMLWVDLVEYDVEVHFGIIRLHVSSKCALGWFGYTCN